MAPDAVAPLGDVPGNAGTVPTITVTAPAADNQAATAVLAGGTVAAGAAEGTLFEVAGSALARLATTTAGQALLRSAGVVVAPEVVAAGTAVYLGYKGVQYLIDHGALPQLPGFSPPPMPTSPPPVVLPQVDNPPEALVSPLVPGQAGNEGFTATQSVLGDLPGLPIDGPKLPIIMEAKAPSPVKVYADNPDRLQGRAPADVEMEMDQLLVQGAGWDKRPSNDGNGIAYRDGKGGLFIINNGYGAGALGGQGDKLHEGAYVKLSTGGQAIRIPLMGNPALTTGGKP